MESLFMKKLWNIFLDNFVLVGIVILLFGAIYMIIKTEEIIKEHQNSLKTYKIDGHHIYVISDCEYIAGNPLVHKQNCTNSINKAKK